MHTFACSLIGIIWNATVNFESASWPAIRARGVLSRATGWSDLINPSSWVRQVTVTAVLIGPDGAPTLVWAQGMKGNDVRRAVQIVQDQQEAFLARWREIHG